MRKCYNKAKNTGARKMARYKVTLTAEEREEWERLIQKGGKGYRIKHAQILLRNL